MSSLYDDLIELKQSLIGIREELGDPRLKSLTFELPQGLTTISPKLTVVTVPEKMIGLPIDNDGRFAISADDLLVKNVARSYDRSYFNYRVWLDAVIINGVVTSGISCRVHVINDKSGLSFHLILRKEIEQSRI